MNTALGYRALRVTTGNENIVIGRALQTCDLGEIRDSGQQIIRTIHGRRKCAYCGQHGEALYPCPKCGAPIE